MELGLLWIVMAINSVGLIVLGCVTWVSAGVGREVERVIGNLHDRIAAVERLRNRVDALENRERLGN